MVNYILVVVSILITCLAAPVLATPTVKLTPTTQSIEKGGIFQIRVEVRTTEDLKDIVIAPLIPNGFTAKPLPGPDLHFISIEAASDLNKDTAEKKPEAKQAIKIDNLTAGSAMTVSFTVHPPSIFWGEPKEGEKEAFYDTRNPGSFVFNITYNAKNGTKGAVTASTEVRYTTAMVYYLLMGMLGVVLGYFIKVATKHRDIITQKLPPDEGFKEIVKIMGKSLVVSNFHSLLTIMMIGFGVLLYMAKDGIPVTSWHQSIASGIGLALLSDEQLLAKFKS